MFCKKCGSQINENDQFCRNCGEKVNNLESNYQGQVNNNTFIELDNNLESQVNNNNLGNNYQNQINNNLMNNTFTNLDNNISRNYKLILNRKKNFVGSLAKFNIYIDNQLVGKIKNGQTLELEVSGGNHQISINKNNSVNININRDTTADVVVYGVNNFGISNVNGETINNNNINTNNNYIIKNEKSTNSVLIASIIPIISVIMFFTISYYITFWVYGLVIGYAIVNISGLKNQKGSANYKKLLTKNIIAIIISAIILLLTAYITIYFS